MGLLKWTNIKDIKKLAKRNPEAKTSEVGTAPVHKYYLFLDIKQSKAFKLAVMIAYTPIFKS